MKKQLHKLRRFFARPTKKLNAATARDAAAASYDEEDNSSRLSGAFVVVLVLHIMALIGVFLFSRSQTRDGGQPAGGKNLASATATGAGTERPATSQPGTPKPAPQTPPAYTSVAPRDPEKPLPPLPPPTARAGKVYIVQPGDNLTIIAGAHSLRPADLKAANELKTDELRPGQELIIPEIKFVKTTADVKVTPKPPEPRSSTPERTQVTFYTVKKGDTLVKIARDHGVSYEELSKANKITDPKKIQLNQKLKIPAKK